MVSRCHQMFFGIAVLGCAFVFQPIFAASKEVPRDPDDKLSDEMKKVQGTWQVTKFIEASEKPAPAREVEEMTFEFKGEQLRISKVKNVRGPEPFKYVLYPTKRPKAIDVFFLGDPDKPTEGIYKLEGDELTICLSGGAPNGKTAPRPTEFKASKRDLYVLFVMKKIKR